MPLTGSANRKPSLRLSNGPGSLGLYSGSLGLYSGSLGLYSGSLGLYPGSLGLYSGSLGLYSSKKVMKIVATFVSASNQRAANTLRTDQLCESQYIADLLLWACSGTRTKGRELSWTQARRTGRRTSPQPMEGPGLATTYHE